MKAGLEEDQLYLDHVPPLIGKLLLSAGVFAFMFYCRLRAAGYRLKFCTNESHDTRQYLVEKLCQHGFKLTLDDIFSPAPACVTYLKTNKLRPFLLVHSSALPEYSDIDCSNPNCIVLGDACEVFNYENMNKAFRILINSEQPTLISLGQGYGAQPRSCTHIVGN